MIGFEYQRGNILSISKQTLQSFFTVSNIKEEIFFQYQNKPSNRFFKERSIDFNPIKFYLLKISKICTNYHFHQYHGTLVKKVTRAPHFETEDLSTHRQVGSK